MAEKKIKLFRAIVTGTGINETLIVLSHEIKAYPASTYHCFVYPNGAIVHKNDFGISSVTLCPIEMTSEELSRI